MYFSMFYCNIIYFHACYILSLLCQINFIFSVCHCINYGEETINYVMSIRKFERSERSKLWKLRAFKSSNAQSIRKFERFERSKVRTFWAFESSNALSVRNFERSERSNFRQLGAFETLKAPSRRNFERSKIADES